ncbi:MAG TPA: FGLLP motif-containing membrane protein [Acidimicrobiales bacterium]|nr:FGLLP motif-containing membrane protein [Acidimicrobiales bacterium]
MKIPVASVGRRRIRRALWIPVVTLLIGPLPMILSSSSAGASAADTYTGIVFVTNLNLNSVTAIDTATSHTTQVHGAPPAMNGPLGIAIAPDGNTAYVTNSNGNTVTPIDIRSSSFSLGSPIRVGSGPAAIAITPNGATAYVSNFNSNTVTPIDLATASPERPIRVGAGPWSIAVSPNGEWVCVSNSEGQSVSVINTSSRQVTSLDLTSAPEAIAIAPSGASAYVANGHVVTPINLSSGRPRLMSAIPVLNGPLGIAITPDGTMAYTANTDDTVTPINLATTPATPAAAFSVGSITQPDGIAIAPDGKTAFVANASNTVTPINIAAKTPRSEAPVQVGSASFGIAIAPGQAPVVHLSVVPAPAGQPAHFAASGSSSSAPITHYDWNFGDGTTASTTTATTTHVYAKAGSYTASVTAVGADGTSTSQTFTGQTVSNNGSPSAKADRSLNVVSSLRSTPSSGPPGIAITLRDPTFTSHCANVNVFFDDQLVDTVTSSASRLPRTRLVIPGDAVLGTHHLEVSCTTARPWLLSTPFSVTSTRNHLSEFSVAMPNPTQLGNHIVASGGFSIGFLLVSRLIAAGFPSEWLDSTYAENRERIQARARRRFPRLFIDREKDKSTSRRMVIGTLLFLGFIGFAGLINSFLDKGFGFNRTTLWLYLGQCIGVAIVTLTSQLPVIFGGLREKRKIHMHVLVGGMIIAIICVSASRAIGLSPGYCYGLIAVFVLRPHTDEKDWGRLHAIASVCVLIVSTAAFFLTVPVFHAATGSHPSPFWLILDPALNVTFLGGFASLAFGMLPLPFLPGRHVRQWNKVAWLVITTIGLIGFVAVLLTPGSGSRNELRHVALVPVFVAFAIFALASLAFMAYFHLRPSPPVPPSPTVTGASAD